MTEQVRPEVTVRRAYQVYLYAVCFVAVFILLFGAATSVYGLVKIAAPETTGGFGGARVSFGDEGFRTEVGGLREAERDRGLAQFLEGAIFAGLAFAVFRFHWQRSGQLRADLDRITAPPPPPLPAAEPEAPAPRRTRRTPG
jgi:hypothetical protein